MPIQQIYSISCWNIYKRTMHKETSYLLQRYSWTRGLKKNVPLPTLWKTVWTHKCASEKCPSEKGSPIASQWRSASCLHRYRKRSQMKTETQKFQITEEISVRRQHGKVYILIRELIKIKKDTMYNLAKTTRSWMHQKNRAWCPRADIGLAPQSLAQ